MGIRVRTDRCDGCGGAAEPPCVRICPGDLLVTGEGGRTSVRDARDCWDCAACVKACPKQAIEMYLPAQVGGRGATLQGHSSKQMIVWSLQHPDGREEVFNIEAERVI